jgi:hypothetical protein
MCEIRSRDSSVGIAMGYGPDGRGIGVLFPPGERDFLFSTASRPALGLHPTSCPMGTGGCFPGGKAAGDEAYHSLPSSYEVKNSGAIPPTLLASALSGAYLIKQGDNFTFTFLSVY